jgi:hypothetical protein
MNPALKKLGFNEQDRVVIIHTDDIGMSQSSLSAYENLLNAGLISSASTMVPCPWFPETARFCRDHPGVDMGVHLTLNAEWATYRWGPISTRDTASGMLDKDGYFFNNIKAVVQSARPEAVAIELKAQLERALAQGIDVTHVDSHMGTVMHEPFLQIYMDLALEYKLPLFMLSSRTPHLNRYGIQPGLVDQLNTLEERGLPLFDAITMMPLDDPEDNIGKAKALFDSLQPGLTYLILHPSADTPEIRGCAPDWPSRVANYAAFSSPELLDYVRQSGIQVIGYRPLRDLIRAA